MIAQDITKSYDVLEICVDLTTLCQIKCPYCYARKDNTKPWGKIMTKSNIDFVLNCLKCGRPITLSLMGGEPTLHPLLKYTIEQAAQIKNIHNIIVYTNAIKIVDINPEPKLIFCLNWHPLNVSLSDFKNSALAYLNKGIHITAAVCIVKNKRQQIADFFTFCKENKIQCEPTYIQVNERTHIYDVQDTIETTKTYMYNNTLMSIRDVMVNGLNKFKGWKCKLNCFTIGVDLKIDRPCVHIDVNLASNSNFFKNHNNDWVICPFDTCTSACWLENPKIKDD